MGSAQALDLSAVLSQAGCVMLACWHRDGDCCPGEAASCQSSPTRLRCVPRTRRSDSDAPSSRLQDQRGLVGTGAAPPRGRWVPAREPDTVECARDPLTATRKKADIPWQLAGGR